MPRCGMSDDSLATHLVRHGLEQAPALAEGLEVAEGWESVSAWVLGPFLKARMTCPCRVGCDGCPDE